MVSLLTRVSRRPRKLVERAPGDGGANTTVPISVMDWAKMFAPGGMVNYQGWNYQAYTTNAASSALTGVVFACERWRLSVFSEARFAWQRMRQGRPMPGAMFGTNALSVLEIPWRGASTRDLLVIAELDVAIHGNSYWVLDELGFLVRLEPTAVKILTEAVYNPITGFRIGERLLGYAVTVDRKVSIYAPSDVAHYKPIPSSSSQWVGTSWISACQDDVSADTQLTMHKVASIANGAALTHVISLDPNLSPTDFDLFVEKFRESHRGPQRAGETVFLQGGSDIKTVGQTFENLALKETQGAGETRIAAAAGVHPVIAGLSEALGSAAMSAGNYTPAKRAFIDGTMCPLWGSFVGAFSSLLTAPGPDVRLWYDTRDIPFMREDVTALAAVMVENATVISTLVTAGFDADTVVQAVINSDVSGLIGGHSGLFSVQLRKPGDMAGTDANAAAAAATNQTPMPPPAANGKPVAAIGGKQ